MNLATKENIIPTDADFATDGSRLKYEGLTMAIGGLCDASLWVALVQVAMRSQNRVLLF